MMTEGEFLTNDSYLSIIGPVIGGKYADVTVRIVMVDSGLVRHKHRGRTKHIRKRIVKQVEERVAVDIGESADLICKESLPRPGPEQRPENTVTHIEIVGGFLHKEVSRKKYT